MSAGDVHVRELGWIEPVEAAARLRRLGSLGFLDSAMRHGTLGRHSYVAAAPFGRFVVEGGSASWNGEALEGAPLCVPRAAHGAASARSAFPVSPRSRAEPSAMSATSSAGCSSACRSLRRQRSGPCPKWISPSTTSWSRSTTSGSGPSSCRPGCRRSTATRGHGGRGTGPTRSRRRCALRPRRRAPPPRIARDAWRSNFTAEAYADAVRRVVEYVLDGDIFQANVAQRFAADLPGAFDPWAFYLKLRRLNEATFCAYLDQGGRIVASSSPERFLKLQAGHVETRPIKGTAPRLPDPEADARSAEALLASEKDRAENLMIVDLLRNDLSRVCRPHSVTTPSLAGLESYAGVHHLVSAVEGDLADGMGALDLLAASFPGGSITGAPKLRAMEIITGIEREARGVYCGAIGWLGFTGDMDLNIAIRTVTFQEGTASFHAGGGVTALSDGEAEYRETLDKAERVFAAFEAE